MALSAGVEITGLSIWAVDLWRTMSTKWNDFLAALRERTNASVEPIAEVGEPLAVIRT